MLDYQKTQMHEKTISYDLLIRLWEVVGAYIFSIVNNKLLYIIDYYSKFTIVKKVDGLVPNNLIGAAKIVFAELV